MWRFVTFWYLSTVTLLCLISTCGLMSPKWESKFGTHRTSTLMRAINFPKSTNQPSWWLKILRSFFTEISPNSAAKKLAVKPNSNNSMSARLTMTLSIGTAALFATGPCLAAICWISTLQRITTHFSPSWPRKSRCTSASFPPAYSCLGPLKSGGTTQSSSISSLTTSGLMMRGKRAERKRASWRSRRRSTLRASRWNPMNPKLGRKCPTRRTQWRWMAMLQKLLQWNLRQLKWNLDKLRLKLWRSGIVRPKSSWGNTCPVWSGDHSLLPGWERGAPCVWSRLPPRALQRPPPCLPACPGLLSTGRLPTCLKFTTRLLRSWRIRGKVKSPSGPTAAAFQITALSGQEFQELFKGRGLKTGIKWKLLPWILPLTSVKVISVF